MHYKKPSIVVLSSPRQPYYFRLCVLVVLSIWYWIPTPHKYCGQISCCCSHGLITCSTVRVYISCARHLLLWGNPGIDLSEWCWCWLTFVHPCVWRVQLVKLYTLKPCAASQLCWSIPLYNAGTDVGLETCRSMCDKLSSLKVFTLRVGGASIDAMI